MGPRLTREEHRSLHLPNTKPTTSSPHNLLYNHTQYHFFSYYSFPVILSLRYRPTFEINHLGTCITAFAFAIFTSVDNVTVCLHSTILIAVAQESDSNARNRRSQFHNARIAQDQSLLRNIANLARYGKRHGIWSTTLEDSSG